MSGQGFGYLVTALTDSTIIYGYGGTLAEAVKMANEQFAGAGNYRPKTKRSQVTRDEYDRLIAAFLEDQVKWHGGQIAFENASVARLASTAHS